MVESPSSRKTVLAEVRVDIGSPSVGVFHVGLLRTDRGAAEIARRVLKTGVKIYLHRT